jgi:hypothetical protein
MPIYPSPDVDPTATLEGYFDTAITSDPDMLEFFPARDVEDWFYSASAMGLGENKPVPKRPYIVWNELPDQVHRTVEETSDARNRNFSFYVYDEQGDYTRIEAILNALRNVVKSMAPFTTTDGVRCSASTWQGVSGQIPNDGYDSCTKFASVSFTVSR